jgi:uncharacterized phage protein gp47/JayE
LADQPVFGVTPDGFVMKGIDRIVADQQARARLMFGDDVDLTSGSALRKVMDAVAWQAQELWRGLEESYYANFVTTAQGSSLDLLGTDLGLDRRLLLAAGQVVLSLANGAPGRTYVLPEGTVIETVAAPQVRFSLTAVVVLTTDNPSATTGAQAMDRGPAGNLPAQQALQLNSDYAALNLNLGAAVVTPTNPAPFIGGDQPEADADYRSRLLGLPRTMWTLDSLLTRVLNVAGVRDAAAFDPLGGVDVSKSTFNLFVFGERTFSQQRLLASPYYFDVIVATDPGRPWNTTGSIPGVFDNVLDAVRQARPVSIFPNIIQADTVEVGLRAMLLVGPGQDQDAIRGQIMATLHTSINGLTIGRSVRYSDVLVLARSIPGVVDVQNLHLRRCPPLFAGVNFSEARFGQQLEVGVGENLTLAAREIPHFTIDSQLIDVQVTTA